MNKKVAVVTDSNSGITQQQAEELGISVVPMPFDVAGQTFYEDINLTQEQFYEKLAQDVDIITSQPSPESVTALWERLLQEYDEVVHIPMSSGLSGSCQTAVMLAEEYGGRVQVVNNQRISVTQRRSVLDALEMREHGMSASEIRELLERVRLESGIYIMVDTLKYLRKGGRITPAAAALGTLFRIKPVLQIHGERLDAFAKARTVQQAKSLMLNALKNDIEHTSGGKVDVEEIHFQVAHTCNEKEAMDLKQQMQEMFPGCGEIYVDRLSLSVSCHIGPGALAVAYTRKVRY